MSERANGKSPGDVAILQAKNLTKTFGATTALDDVSLELHAGEVLCLLGDNGAGKSTLIKILSGVLRPSDGELFVDGKLMKFDSPRKARELGIATVPQTGGTFPLLSVWRNFFLGAEPTRGWGPFRRIDRVTAVKVTLSEIESIGLRGVNDAEQLVGTLSGGERQGLAIARAMWFGARGLILDEPTSALGVRQAATVLRFVARARSRGAGVIFITHNAHHALAVGDRFVVLIHGSIAASFRRGEKTREEILNLMAGGEEMEALERELASEDSDFGGNSSDSLSSEPDVSPYKEG
jgi:simple sugar transport system ATP-binding protein